MSYPVDNCRAPEYTYPMMFPTLPPNVDPRGAKEKRNWLETLKRKLTEQAARRKTKRG